MRTEKKGPGGINTQGPKAVPGSSRSKPPAQSKSLADLANEKIWVAWQQEQRNGKLTKIPKNPATGGNAMVPTNPSTYGTRAAAEKRWQSIQKKNKDAVGGIGIVLGELGDGLYLVGIDLDSCLTNGTIDEWALIVIARFDTYAEISPSGTGVKLFFLMTADGWKELLDLLGVNQTDRKQLTRKAFTAGPHREIAIDTARFYAVTEQRYSKQDEFRLVPYTDVEWFIKVAGPKYLQQQKSGNGHDDNPYSAYGREAAKRLDHQYDESGSGYGFRFMQGCHAEDMSYGEAREAILADDGDAGEWANRTDERQLKRAYDNSKAFAEPKQKKAEQKTTDKKKKAEDEDELPTFRSYFLEQLQLHPLVPLQWIVEDFILAQTVNGLFGDGGIGKDLLLLQLAIAMTCGGKWLGRNVKQGRVMYFPVEDDDNELRRRENNITSYFSSLGCYHPVPETLKIVPLLGQQTVLAYNDPKSGIVQPTPAYEAVCKMIEEFRPELVIVGNRVNIFAVNQNDDAQARQCIQWLSAICKCYQTGIIMPGHVSLARSGADQGTSGSVQWSNGPRMRLYLRKPKADKDSEQDDDPTARELEVMKANWAATGIVASMNWSEGVFKPDRIEVTSLTPEKEKEKDPGALDLEDEEEVLRLLDGLVKGQHVSPERTSHSNVYKEFSKRGRFRGHRGRLEAAVKRLYDKGTIDTRVEGPPSRRKYSVVRS